MDGDTMRLGEFRTMTSMLPDDTIVEFTFYHDETIHVPKRPIMTVAVQKYCKPVVHELQLNIDFNTDS